MVTIKVVIFIMFSLNSVLYTSKTSIPAVGTTQTPKKGLGFLLWEGVEVDDLPSTSAEVKNE